jgi:hypothetical protein
MPTKTGFMKIICTECREAFPMFPDRAWYNFVDSSYRDGVGFCSPKCLEVYAVKRKWSVTEEASK